MSVFEILAWLAAGVLALHLLAIVAGTLVGLAVIVGNAYHKARS